MKLIVEIDGSSEAFDGVKSGKEFAWLLRLVADRLGRQHKPMAARPGVLQLRDRAGNVCGHATITEE